MQRPNNALNVLPCAGGAAPSSGSGGVKWYVIVIPVVGALLLLTVAVLAALVARRWRQAPHADGKGPYEVRLWVCHAPASLFLCH